MIDAPVLPRKIRRGVTSSPASLVVTYVTGDIDAHRSPRLADVEKLLDSFLAEQEICDGVRRFDVYRFGVLLRTVQG